MARGLSDGNEKLCDDKEIEGRITGGQQKAPRGAFELVEARI
jgi:hypothetical protein